LFTSNEQPSLEARCAAKIDASRQVDKDTSGRGGNSHFTNARTCLVSEHKNENLHACHTKVLHDLDYHHPCGGMLIVDGIRHVHTGYWQGAAVRDTHIPTHL
jgi:hypothetical protein